MNTFWIRRSVSSVTSIVNSTLYAAVGGGPYNSPPPPTCFPRGTKILLADGRQKNIETIRQEDVVLSYNLETKKLTNTKVRKLVIHSGSNSPYLIINNLLKITNEHLIFLDNKWNEARSVAKGDTLLDKNGERLGVISVERRTGEIQDMYNLELNGAEHNFFAEGILVHNIKGGGGSGGIPA